MGADVDEFVEQSEWFDDLVQAAVQDHRFASFSIYAGTLEGPDYEVAYRAEGDDRMRRGEKTQKFLRIMHPHTVQTGSVRAATWLPDTGPGGYGLTPIWDPEQIETNLTMVKTSERHLSYPVVLQSLPNFADSSYGNDASDSIVFSIGEAPYTVIVEAGRILDRATDMRDAMRYQVWRLEHPRGDSLEDALDDRVISDEMMFETDSPDELVDRLQRMLAKAVPADPTSQRFSLLELDPGARRAAADLPPEEDPMRQRYSLLELNPANFTAKGERMYEDIKRGYQAKGDPRAKEIAARTVYARAAEGVPGLVKATRKNPDEWIVVIKSIDAKGVRHTRRFGGHRSEDQARLYGEGLGVPFVVERARGNPLEDPGGEFDDDIIMGMERAIWVTSYADWADEQPKHDDPKLARTQAWRVASGRAPEVHRAGPGEDWNEVAPAAPASAGEAAQDLWLAIERKNGKTLGELLDDAAKADGKRPTHKYADSFGHYLAMQAMGHGVGWFDDHKTFPLKLPHFEFHTFDGEEIEWSPRIRSTQNPCGGTRRA